MQSVQPSRSSDVIKGLTLTATRMRYEESTLLASEFFISKTNIHSEKWRVEIEEKVSLGEIERDRWAFRCVCFFFFPPEMKQRETHKYNDVNVFSFP